MEEEVKMSCVQTFDAEVTALLKECADLLYSQWRERKEEPEVVVESSAICLRDTKEPCAVMGSEKAIWNFGNIDYAVAWSAAMSYGLRRDVKLVCLPTEKMWALAGNWPIEVLLPPHNEPKERGE